MDDLLLALRCPVQDNIVLELKGMLEDWGLVVAPEKIQRQPPWKYWGMTLTETVIRAQKLTILADNFKTLNDVQKLVGDLQWIQNICGITNTYLQPLYELLQDRKDPYEPRQLTQSAEAALQVITQKISHGSVSRILEGSPIQLYIYDSWEEIIGILAQWQEQQSDPLCILEWIFGPSHFKRTVTKTIEAIVAIIHKGCQRAKIIAGAVPHQIIMPLTSQLVTQFCQTNDEFAAAVLNQPFVIGNHYLHHPWFKTYLWLLTRNIVTDCLLDALTVFTDASSKLKRSGFVWQLYGYWYSHSLVAEGSAQILEHLAVVEVLKWWPQQPLNIVIDSLYVIGIVQRLHFAFIGKIQNPLLFSAITQ